MRSSLGVCLLAAAAIGCATDPYGPPAGITFEVRADTYARADTIELQFANNSGTTLYTGIPTCTVKLDMRVGDEWTAVERRQPPMGCDPTSFGISHDEPFTQRQPIREWMPAGEYRFRLGVGWDHNGDRRYYQLTSNIFHILAE